MQKYFPTLWPWFKARIFALLTLLSSVVAGYGFYASSNELDGEDNSVATWAIAVGVIGLVNFGVISLIKERRSLTSRVVGGIGVAAGIVAAAVVAFFAVVILLTLFWVLSGAK